ncbi:MAG: biotin attachment protein [Candidatus Stahlbacteria bacterium]|nr:biotin attachment protein [Candidatus Stahlbacteria bacterium]
MENKFTYLGELHKIKIDPNGISVDGKEKIAAECITFTPNVLSLVVDGKFLTAYVANDKNKSYVFIDGAIFILEKAEAQQTRDISIKPSGNIVVSLMPGALVKLLVSEGSKVKSGQTVAIVEAMKMQNELKAPIDGIVKKVNYKEGNQVDALTPIVELEVKKNT